MSYNINDTQKGLLGQLVCNKNVIDLGAGGFEFSTAMLRAGAESVHAVDKEPAVINPYLKMNPKFTFTLCYFSEFKQRLGPHINHFDVMLLSWPVCYPGIEMTWLVEMANTVIYVGCTFDGTMCGDPRLWEHLKQRVVLHYEPDRRNSMIVYGKEKIRRRALPEESTGVKSRDNGIPIVNYADINFAEVSNILKQDQT